MTYRWLTDEEILQEVNPLLVQQGWPELNVNPGQPTCLVTGAFDDSQLIGVFAVQLFPVVGPMLVVESHRNNKVGTELAAEMQEFLTDVQARGYLVICDNPISEKLALDHGMTKVESPVYIMR